MVFKLLWFAASGLVVARVLTPQKCRSRRIQQFVIVSSLVRFAQCKSEQPGKPGNKWREKNIYIVTTSLVSLIVSG